MTGPPPGPRLYLDLAVPECWLAAERAIALFGGPVEWVPVVETALPAAGGGLSLAEVAATAERRGLLAVRDGAAPPPDPRPAALAATYARRTGRTVAFALAAMRQAWSGGRDLSEPDTLAIAGAACELHPRALLAALALPGTAAELDAACAEALAAGVARTPAAVVGGRAYGGDAALDEAAAALAGAARPPDASSAARAPS